MLHHRKYSSIIALLLIVVAGTCTGCDPPSFVAGFGAGYAAGRLGIGSVQAVTTERVCYQHGVRVPCPEVNE